MDMDFVCAFELDYGRMVDFSRIIALLAFRRSMHVHFII